MIAAILTAVVLILGAAATAMVLGWRRHAAEPAPVERRIDGPTCYPRVKR